MKYYDLIIVLLYGKWATKQVALGSYNKGYFKGNCMRQNPLEALTLAISNLFSFNLVTNFSTWHSWFMGQLWKK